MTDQCPSCGGFCADPCERADVTTTHCIDCRHSVLRGAELCSNPAAATLDDEQRRQYDDPMQPCPCFEAKECADE